MPEVTTERSPLYDTAKGTQQNLGTITFSAEEWKKMTEKEKKHAKNCSSVNFISLLWYAKEMRRSRCTYKEAVCRVLKRKV